MPGVTSEGDGSRKRRVMNGNTDAPETSSLNLTSRGLPHKPQRRK